MLNLRRHPPTARPRRAPQRFFQLTLPCVAGLWLVAAAVATAPAPGPPAPEAPAPLLTVEAIHAGNPSTISAPVRLRGVVTFVHPSEPRFFLHDPTGQIAIDLTDTDSQRPRTGDVVALEGIVEPAKHRPRVHAQRLTTAGAAPLPFAPEITFATGLSGRREDQWVRLRGTLLRNESLGEWQRLTLTAPAGGEFTVSIPTAERLNAPAAADLEVRGVCQLWTGSDNVTVGGFFLFAPSLTEVRFRATAEVDSAPLTRVEQVRRLPAAAAIAGHPVRLQGVVTFAHPDWRVFYLDDTTGGVLAWPESGDCPLPAVGAAVTVEGRTSAGTPSVGIRALRILTTGTRPLPVPRPIRLEAALTGAEDAQWVEMRGRLRQVDALGGWLRLFLTTAAGEITVSIPQTAPVHADAGSLLVVRGVCQSWMHEHNRIGGFFLYTPSTAELSVAAPPPRDPFAVPAESIANLALYRPETLEMQQVRVSGTVLLHRPGHSVVLQNDSGVVRAFTVDTTPLQPGDRIEVAGVPGHRGNRSVLRGAVYRRLGPGPAPEPRRLPARPRIDASLDERLVALTGLLTTISIRRDDTRLLLESGGVPVEVTYPGALPLVAAGTLRAGARLAIVGLYNLEYDQDDVPAAFSIQLRSPTDLVVEAQPSWWTTRRALTALGAIALCLFAGLGWLFVLRRQLRRQTGIIREQVAQQVALDARHRAIVENATDFIFSTDLAGRLVSRNPAGERLTGHPAAAALALGDLFDSPETIAMFLAQGQQPAAAPALHFEARLCTRDGRLVPVEIGARALREEGRVSGLLGIARDITVRKQMEELNRRVQTAESLGRMAAAIAHHFNNQIQVVLMGLEMVRLEIAHSPASHEILAAAERSARQASEIGSLMLTYLGQAASERRALDLAAACRPTVIQFRARLRPGPVLTAALPDPGPFVFADAAQLQRVLLCLLANAEEAVAAAGGTIRVEIGTVAATEIPAANRVPIDFTPHVPAYACVSVADNGGGIAEHDLGKIFDPFFTTKFHGRGTGLAIVLGIARSHDGAVAVESHPGEGSRFQLFLPLRPDPGTAN